VNQDQIDRFIDYFQTCWPASTGWSAEQWRIWGGVLAAHGPHYVRTALLELVHDPVGFGEWPPGLAAFTRALDRAEAYERERLEYIDRQLRLDAAAGRAADDDIANGRTPADDPAALRAKMDQGRAARQHYIDRLMR
jgi:hypothetical protein